MFLFQPNSLVRTSATCFACTSPSFQRICITFNSESKSFTVSVNSCYAYFPSRFITKIENLWYNPMREIALAGTVFAEAIGNSRKDGRRMYDVIVVGAGPAGCTAAKILAEKGCKVLMVEKFKMPRYKSCSGVLIKKSMELVKEYFGEIVPESVMCAPVKNRGMIFTNDIGKEYRFEQEGLNVWRSHFDGWLAGRAKESGAEVRDGVAALSCEEKDGFVEVSLHGEYNDTERARYVIDCEGVVGTLKRKITGEVPGYIITFQTFNEGSIDLDPHYFYA